MLRKESYFDVLGLSCRRFYACSWVSDTSGIPFRLARRKQMFFLTSSLVLKMTLIFTYISATSVITFTFEFSGCFYPKRLPRESITKVHRSEIINNEIVDKTTGNEWLWSTRRSGNCQNREQRLNTDDNRGTREHLVRGGDKPTGETNQGVTNYRSNVYF